MVFLPIDGDGELTPEQRLASSALATVDRDDESMAFAAPEAAPEPYGADDFDLTVESSTDADGRAFHGSRAGAFERLERPTRDQDDGHRYTNAPKFHIFFTDHKLYALPPMRIGGGASIVP